MARLVWDEVGSHVYETGVSQGVLFLQNSDGSYQNGVAWNGLTRVSKKYSSENERRVYTTESRFDKYYATEEVSATIEAYTYPREFEKCEGSGSIMSGISVGLQMRRKFALCWKTLIGNDVAGNDLGYKIHVLYNCLASPSDKSYGTLNDSLDVGSFSWDIVSIPVEIGTGFRPTSIMEIDSRDLSEDQLAIINEALFGSDSSNSYLPSPLDIASLMWSADLTWERVQESVNDGTMQFYKPVGSSITIDKWHQNEGDAGYDMVWDVVDYDENGNMTLKSHYAIPTTSIGAMAYDVSEAIYYATAKKSAGNYYLKPDSADATSSGFMNKKKAIGFTLQNPLEIGDQIVLNVTSLSTDPTNNRTGYVYTKDSITAKETFVTSDAATVSYTQTLLSAPIAGNDAGISYSTGNTSNYQITGILSYTDYILVASYDELKYQVPNVSQNSGKLVGFAFYNSSKTFISGVQSCNFGASLTQGYSTEFSTVSVPSTARYVRFTVLTDTATYGTIKIYGIDHDIYSIGYIGTKLGEYKKSFTNGQVNAAAIACQGLADIYSYSNVYKWLSNNAADWWVSKGNWQRPPKKSSSLLSSSVRRFQDGLSQEFLSIVGTSVQQTAHSSALNGTNYDGTSGLENSVSVRFFIPSLTEIYAVEDNQENAPYQYYKKLAASEGLSGKFQLSNSYPSLKVYAINNQTYAVSYHLRSVVNTDPTQHYVVNTTGAIGKYAASATEYVVPFCVIKKTS